MEIKIKKNHPDAKLPVKSSEHAAAYDIFCVERLFVFDETTNSWYVEYKTGLCMEIPVGYVGKIFPRSSISKTGLVLCNSVGIIDSDYRGEVTVRFKYFGGAAYQPGDRIIQIRIEKNIEVDFIESTELTDTKRGTGGYGSTGK